MQNSLSDMLVCHGPLWLNSHVSKLQKPEANTPFIDFPEHENWTERHTAGKKTTNKT